MESQMKLLGRFSHQTKSGHKVDVAKSAMQKYARRGMAPEMVSAMTEMDAFKVYEDQPAAKAVRTNMINRLKITLFEDVSFAEVDTFVDVVRKVSEWQEDRSKYTLLMEICFDIALAKKLRQPSFLRAKFGYVEETYTQEEFLEGLKTNTYQPSFAWMYQNELEAVELLRQHVGKLPENIQPLVKFALAEHKRMLKSTRVGDRLIFMVVPWLWILFNMNQTTDAATGNTYMSKKDTKSVYKNNGVEFDEFVYDMHTAAGRAAGKERKVFRTEGAVVFNEDTDWFVQEFKDVYMVGPPADALVKKTPKKSPKKKSPKRSPRAAGELPRTNKNPTRDNLSFEELSDVVLHTDGVCGGKLPCFFATHMGVRHTYKPMPKSMNFGRDYAFVDEQKSAFGLNDLGVTLFTMDKAIKGTKATGFTWNEEEQVVARMTLVENKEDVGKNKKMLNKEEVFDEVLKIRLFDGLFRSSDNILRNILVGTDDKLYSIDENDIYGKRAKVFNKTEPMKGHRFFTRERITSVIESMELPQKRGQINQALINWGFDKHVQTFNERIEKYTGIVLEELGMKE